MHSLEEFWCFGWLKGRKKLVFEQLLVLTLHEIVVNKNGLQGADFLYLIVYCVQNSESGTRENVKWLGGWG